MKKAVMNGTLLLALSGFVSKLLGAVYRIPLTNILGAEGIGAYQLVFPIYALVITLSSGAVPVVVSRLIAEENALTGGAGNYSVFKASFKLLVFSGAAAALLTAALSLPFALMQGEKSVWAGYVAVAPSVLFAAAGAAYRGLFLGNTDMRPSAFAQLAEQLVKMAFGLSAAIWLSRYSVRAAVIGALGAITISEIASFVVYFIIYSKRKGELKKYPLPKEGERDMLKLLFKLVLPILAAEAILPLSAFLDSLIIVNLLKNSMTAGQATAQYGLWTGPVNSVVNLPAVLSLALSVAVVPTVSKQRVLLDAQAAKSKSTTSLKLAFAVGLPSALALVIIARPCISLLYPNFSEAETAAAAALLRIGAINCLSVSTLQIYNSLLQALDKSKFPIYSLAGGVAVKIALEFALIPVIGINGAAVASVAGFALSATADALYYHYLLGANVKLSKSIGKIALSGVIMGAAVYAAARFLPAAILKVLVAVAAGLAIYAFAVLLTGVFDKEELAGIPVARLFAGKRKSR